MFGKLNRRETARYVSEYFETSAAARLYLRAGHRSPVTIAAPGLGMPSRRTGGATQARLVQP